MHNLADGFVSLAYIHVILSYSEKGLLIKHFLLVCYTSQLHLVTNMLTINPGKCIYCGYKFNKIFKIQQNYYALLLLKN